MRCTQKLTPSSAARANVGFGTKELRSNGRSQAFQSVGRITSGLGAFEDDGWPPRIDDPLPPQKDQDSKRRLADTSGA